MHKALHPRADINRLYVSRKEVGGGLTNIEDCVGHFNTRTQREHEKIQQRQTTTASNMRRNRKQNWEEKQMYRYYK